MEDSCFKYQKAAAEGDRENCKKHDRLAVKWKHEVQTCLFFTKKNNRKRKKCAWLAWRAFLLTDRTRRPYKPKLVDRPFSEVSKPM
jgi:hypothetical protein